MGRANQVWRVLPVAGFLLIGLYYVLPLTAVPAACRVAIYAGISYAAVAAIVLGVRWHRPAHTWAWWWVAAGQAASATADLMFFALRLMDGNDAFPSLADVFYLAEYPLCTVGLVLMVRYRTPGWDVAGLVDAAILTLSASLLSWVFLIQPTAGAAGLTLAGRLVSGAYPAGDLLLAAVAIRLMLGAAIRTGAFYLLAGWLGLLLIADTAYAVESLLGVYQAGGHLDAVWMASSLMLGAAGLHPSMAQLTQRSASAAPQVTPARLLSLAVASILAPATLLVRHAAGVDDHAILSAVVCIVLFLLVLVRMAGLVRTQQRMAITDALTGLRNRRFFEQVLATDTARILRQRTDGRQLGLLLIDIDHFKAVNDTYGHAGGDRVLIELTQRLQLTTRTDAVLARYGGEEFAVLTQVTDARELAVLGERLRTTVAAVPFPVTSDTHLPVTISLGAACLPQHASEPDDLALAADRALYVAKETGRNRLVCATPDNPRRKRVLRALP